MVGLSVGKSLLLREQQMANSQPTPTHAGGDHKLSAAVAFCTLIPNFSGGGVLKNPAAAERPARRRALSGSR